MISILILGLFGVLRFLANRWKHSRRRKKRARKADRPSLEFYAAALESLDRIGVRRLASETPLELEHRIESTLAPHEKSRLAGPIRKLTSVFYQIRYRGIREGTNADATASALDELNGNIDAMCQDKQTAGAKADAKKTIH